MKYRPLIWSAGIAATSVAILALYLFGPAGFAYGWTVSALTEQNAIHVERTMAETGSATVVYYFTTANPTAAQLSAGSFDSTASGGRFNGITASTVQFDADCLAVDLENTQNVKGYWLVVTPDGRRTTLGGGFNTWPKAVYLAPAAGSSSLVTVPVSIVGTVPVSQSASLALAGTMTVDPWITAGLPDRWQVALVAIFVIMAAVHPAFFIVRRARRRGSA